MALELKDTLQLPKTDFPMRAGLAQREPGRVAHWEKTGLYAAIQQRRASSPAFVLHDGPPFTNGDVHIGTALNKTLKDIIVRYKAMRGFRAPYVPGWDCHGLPIEIKVDNELGSKKARMTAVEIRRATMGQVYFATTSSRAFTPAEWHASVSVQNFSRAAASASSPPSTTILAPDAPTSSKLHPRVMTGGRPQAMASRIDMLKVSYTLG